MQVSSTVALFLTGIFGTNTRPNCDDVAFLQHMEIPHFI